MFDRPADPHARDLPRWTFVAGVLTVVALQIALIATHDYFVDEWQALQIAVQSPDMAALLTNLRYEGHPPLWYLLLRGLAAVLGADRALAVASLLCALATLALVAKRAPLPRWARLAVILAEPILFEYGTISRGYSLGVSLTFAALVLWDRRRVFWVVLALLPLVDFLFGVIALGLIALRWSERDKVWWPGIALFGVCSALAGWTVIPAPDFLSVYPQSTPLQALMRWTSEMAVAALPIQWNDGPRWDAPWTTPATPFLGIAFLFVIFHQTRGRRVERAVALAFPLVLLAFMVAVHMLTLRHALLSSVVFMAVLWLQGAASVAIGRPTAVWLAAGALCGLATAGFAVTRPFDTAPEAVRAIRTLKLQNKTWLSFPMQHAQGVSALSGIPFEALERGCRPDFVRWNFRHRLTTPELLRDWLVREAGRSGSFYLLTQYVPAPGSPATYLTTIAPGLDGKVYHIYRVAGAQSGERAPAPPCVTGNRALPPLGTR